MQPWWPILALKRLWQWRPTIITPSGSPLTSFRFDVEDVLFEITPYLDFKDLQSFSLAASCCRRPAQKYLFRSLSVTLPESTTHFRDTIAFLSMHAFLCGYVRALALHSPRFSAPAPVSLDCVADVIGYFPALQVLSLTFLRWVSGPNITCIPSLRLQTLRLSYIEMGSFIDTASPFEILSLVRSCTTVVLTACDLDAFLNKRVEDMNTLSVDSLVINTLSHDLEIPGKRFPMMTTLPFNILTTFRARDLGPIAVECLVRMMEAGLSKTIVVLDLHFQRLNDRTHFSILAIVFSLMARV